MPTRPKEAQNDPAAPREQVTFSFDGAPVTAAAGIPLAAALVGAGKLQLARSPKFHRPRGPSCMRGACDGCLCRVDGEPNVLSCTTPVAAGMKVESQNTLGTREVDLLRVTDWFFPNGMNHHELFAGVPGVSGLMQVFARRVAGLGKLPTEVLAQRSAVRRKVDVLVVGAGPSGLSVALELSSRGRAVELVDDAVALGGSLRSLSPSALGPFSPVLEGVRSAIAAGSLTLRQRTTVGGVFGDDVLAVGPNGAEILEARAVVLAPGAHDGVLAFEGNDVPGVMSARALGMLLSLGVVRGSRIAIVDAGGGGAFAESAKELAEHQKLDVVLTAGAPVSVRGTSRVKGARVRAFGGETQDLDCDILAIDAPSAPAYELCEQAGATLRHEPRGYVVATDGGRIRGSFWALGEACGTHFTADALGEEARVVARAILA